MDRYTIKKFGNIVLAFIMLVGVLVGPNHFVQAAEENTLRMTLKDYDQILNTLSEEDQAEASLEFWRISHDDVSDQRTELVDELHELSVEELNERYEEVERPIEFHEAYVSVDGIGPGSYYVRDILQTDQWIYSYEFVFAFTETSPNTLTIYTKEEERPEVGSVLLRKVDDQGNVLADVGFNLHRSTESGTEELSLTMREDGAYVYDVDGEINPVLYTNADGHILVENLPYGSYVFTEVDTPDGYQPSGRDYLVLIESADQVQIEVVNERVDIPYGSYEFLKVSDNEARSPLQGARFRVTRLLEDGSYEDVIKDGQIYEVTSDVEGRFTVENLPFGDYYLWETQAPEAHIELDEPVHFEISEVTPTRLMVIENRRRPPVDMPQTGDITLLVAIIVSVLLIVLGRKLLKDDEEITE